MFDSELKYRKAVRGILLTPEGKILLIEVAKPDSDFRVWIMPGGGIDGEEAPEDCLRREIEEETGLADVVIGPQVWTRCHTFDWGDTQIKQEELYFLVETRFFMPDLGNNPDPIEQSATRQFRWWTIDEIEVSDDVFAPRKITEHLRNLITNGCPDVSFDCGI